MSNNLPPDNDQPPSLNFVLLEAGNIAYDVARRACFELAEEIEQGKFLALATPADALRALALMLPPRDKLRSTDENENRCPLCMIRLMTVRVVS
jgi:hypothetical protein